MQLRAFCLSPGWDPAPGPGGGEGAPEGCAVPGGVVGRPGEGFSPAGSRRGGAAPRGVGGQRLLLASVRGGSAGTGRDGTGSRSPLTRATTPGFLSGCSGCSRPVLPHTQGWQKCLQPGALGPSAIALLVPELASSPVSNRALPSFRYDEPQSAGNRWAKFSVNCSLFPEQELMVGLLRFCDTAAFALSKARGKLPDLLDCRHEITA